MQGALATNRRICGIQRDASDHGTVANGRKRLSTRRRIVSIV